MLEAKMDYYGAQECFSSAVAQNQNYADAYLEMATCAYYLEQYDLAQTYLETAKKYKSLDTKIQNLEGFILIATGKTKEAKDVFSSILQKMPNDIDARFGLAELELYDGKIADAQKLYEDALKRYTTSKKALLSLALLKAQDRDFDVATKYINLALQHHNDSPDVHYMASYLYCQKKDFAKAQEQILSAIQLQGDYTQAYILLSQILFLQGEYQKVNDLCLFLLNKDRNLPAIWYLNGLSFEKQGDAENAMKNYSAGLEVDPTDYVARCALELLVMDTLPLEDSRRAVWADFHTQKALSYMKKYDSVSAMYEYNRALDLNPYDNTARNGYNQLLKAGGNYELYLKQLEFLKQHQKKDENDKRQDTILQDTLEALQSMLTYSLANKWGVDPFYLDKTRWHFGIYYFSHDVQLLHPDIARLTCGMLQQMFNQVSSIELSSCKEPVSSVSQAFRAARKARQDFFVVLSADENTREITLNATIFNGATGAECAKYTIFRTGRDRYANVMMRLCNNMKANVGTKGKILKRNGNAVLLDLGRQDGIKEKDVFDVIRQGQVKISDKDNKIAYEDSSVLGQVVITKVSEEVAEGNFVQKGFYDRQNIGDEVVLLPSKNQENLEQTATPPVEEAQKTEQKNVITAQDLSKQVVGTGHISSLLELIKNIH